MRVAAVTSKLVFPIISGCLLSLALPMKIARADYLIPPTPIQFVECVDCSGNYQTHYKHHHTAYKRHRYHQEISSPCSYRSQCGNDFVNFIGDPAPRNRGRWVNTDDCDNYDLDMSTGDDDPNIYSGMDIDN